MPSAGFDELTDVLGLLYNRKTEDLDAEIEDLIAQRQLPCGKELCRGRPPSGTS